MSGTWTLRDASFQCACSRRRQDYLPLSYWGWTSGKLVRGGTPALDQHCSFSVSLSYPLASLSLREQFLIPKLRHSPSDPTVVWTDGKHLPSAEDSWNWSSLAAPAPDWPLSVGAPWRFCLYLQLWFRCHYWSNQKDYRSQQFLAVCIHCHTFIFFAEYFPLIILSVAASFWLQQQQRVLLRLVSWTKMTWDFGNFSLFFKIFNIFLINIKPK